MAEVIIYTKTGCPYCLRAKALLNEKGVTFTELDSPTGSPARLEMETRTGGKTVPQIIINGQPYGGCDDLYALEAAGKLDLLLKMEKEQP